MTSSIPNRWLIAVLGVLLQLCLGTVYAWSYFQKPLVETYHWGSSPVAWVFSLAILFLSLAAALGGALLPRIGPRRLAMLGGFCFGLGYLLAALALHIKSLPLMYLGYGVIGGTGLGLGYVTPVATVAKWFPDKKGLVSGMVVMGFGFGALLMAKVLAPVLMHLTDKNLVIVFGALGIIFLAITLPAASFLRNPPTDYIPPGYQPPKPETGLKAVEGHAISAAHAIVSWKFGLMWLVFFCNIVAGIMFIGFQSPMLQDILKAGNAGLTAAQLAASGATLIAISSIFNGVGRFFWGGLSDKLHRAATFRILLGTQIIAFELLLLMGNTISPWMFGLLVCYVLLCYGGGFGTMPSFVLDVFGWRLMPLVYGSILTAWGAGGIVGPQLVALIKDHAPQQASFYAFSAGAGFLALGFIAALMLTDKRHTSKAG
ncbi:MAG: OFA family MFS transporter [Kiritimatiellae bacterium]|nr:OFA family MFS transporter [Kiritimatiellia bacterium]